MNKVQWIKISTDIVNNRKIKALHYEYKKQANEMILLWFWLLITAGQINDDGKVYFTETIPYDADKLSREFTISKPVVEKALQYFRTNEMISIDSKNIIQIQNWNEYQNAEKLEKIREQGRERQQRYYETHRKPNPPTNDKPNDNPNDGSNGNLTETNKEKERTKEKVTDIDKELDVDLEKKREEPTLNYKVKSVRRVNFGYFVNCLVDDGYITSKSAEEIRTIVDRYFDKHLNDWKPFMEKLEEIVQTKPITPELIRKMIENKEKKK